MMNQRTNLGRSIDVALYLNSIPLGGQQGASLIRQSNIIDITNKINGDWQESLAGTKNWSIQCSGLYVIDDSSFNLLEQAFIENTPLNISISIGSKILKGKALIIDFPLTAVFNKEFKYSIKLLGTGALKEE